MSNDSMQGQFLTHLQTGATVTRRQATAFFGLRNPSATVYALREEGVCVYANNVTLKDGRKTVAYRIGRPSKAIIAAGFASLGASA